MSAQPVEEPRLRAPEGSPDHESTGRPEDRQQAPASVEVRRNAPLFALVGVAASAIATAYLWRAAGTGAPLDWVLCLALGLLSAVFLRGLLDSRTPLLVADELGVQVRLGSSWRGLPWEAVERVVVESRRGWFRDGRVVVTLHHLERAIEGLERRARRQATLNQRSHGAALAVPLGLTTRVPQGAGDLAVRLAELTQGRAEVVTRTRGRAPSPGTAVEPLDQAAPGPSGDLTAVVTATPDGTEASFGGEPAHSRLLSFGRRRNGGRVEREPAHEQEQGAAAESGPVTVRETAFDPDPDSSRAGNQPGDQPGGQGAQRGSRTRAGASALGSLRDAGPRVRAIAKLGEPVAPLVIDDFQTEPAYDPVIGPELAAARTRVGLSVDELAERTRIRPHVIESIEVDDFTPCGGDFYARGHIRTLARVLGKDPAPLLTAFDARYAQAPINARRVFEAELATGMTGSMRSTVGGPNWRLLAGVVLTLVLVWSLVRLFAGSGQETLQNPPPLLNGSAGIGEGYNLPQEPTGPKPMAMVLTAVNGGAHVRVRDGERRLVFEGDLVIGEVQRLEIAPPVTVATDNGGAVAVAVAGRDMGFLGELDQPGRRSFARPAQRG